MGLELRIFLSSPGDVADERALARSVIAKLPREPQFVGRLRLEEVAWDSPGASVPLEAHITPQEAINQRRPKPSDCDVVVVVLWSRMGTPLPGNDTKPGGRPYHSGTEWEYLDALEAAKTRGSPQVLVYRRDEVPDIKLDDLEAEEKLRQYKLVGDFFQGFVAEDGALKGAYHAYSGPSDFQELLENHLRELLWARLEVAPAATAAAVEPEHGEAHEGFWTDNPYKGLAAFDTGDAPIFFGRGRETDYLVRHFASVERRFLAVIGPSGSGKSSLVAAGLLPRLNAGASPGSQDWRWLRFTPGEMGDDPFTALAVKLKAQHRAVGDPPRALAKRLREDPCYLETLAASAFEEGSALGELLLFVDQFEELFTLVAEVHRQPFIELIGAATRSTRLRVVLTLRADFYGPCTHHEALAALLRTGSFALSPPGVGALSEMIEHPAQAAGLTFDAGLVQRLLDETGTGVGALPLLEFTLERLFEVRTDGRLSFDAYEQIKGVGGSIEARAKAALTGEEPVADTATLETLFSALVAVGADGTAMRRRGALSELSQPVCALAERLAKARLLTMSGDEAAGRVVEVSHEAVLQHWQQLKQWVNENQDFLLWRPRVQGAVEQWERSARDEGALLRGSPLAEAEGWHAQRRSELDVTARAFIESSIAVRDQRAAAREQEAKRRRRWIAMGVVTVLLLSAVALWQYRASVDAAQRELDQRVRAHVADSYQRLRRDPLQALELSYRATAIRQTPKALTALMEARAVALERRANRAEEAQLLGLGPGYLASRWRRGDAFSRLSRDGRFALVATERGKGGSVSPGKVYLVNMGNSHTTELLAGRKAKGRRLEFAGFSRSGAHIFITRQFYLDVYDLRGERIKSVQLEYHAKPVHLVAGMFGSFVLAADTTGNVMMADSESGDRPQLVYARRDGSALLAESSPSGRNLVLVFEKGAVDFLTLDNPRKVRQTRLALSGVVFAIFDADESRRRLLLATASGTVQVWRYGDGDPQLSRGFQHGDTPVRLAAFSADGTRVVSIGDDESMAIWDIESGGLVANP